MFCIGTHDIAIHEVNCLSKLYDIKNGAMAKHERNYRDEARTLFAVIVLKYVCFCYFFNFCNLDKRYYYSAQTIRLID